MYVKKLWILLFSVCLLTGCAAKETFETVDDQLTVPVSASVSELKLSLPEDASVLTMEHEDGGKLYLCDGYTITVQTYPAGDLEQTLYQTSGYSKEKLKVIESNSAGVTRYDWVWAAAGEEGDQVCRAALLDDGNYHYVVTVMAPADTAGELTQTWNSILSSLTLSTD